MLRSSVQHRFEIHDCSRICQGDILRDLYYRSVEPDGTVAEYKFPYAVVVSQDCDLQQAGIPNYVPATVSIQNNQYVSNILMVLAFPADSARSGDHLQEMFGVRQEHFNSQRWRAVCQNKDERYHFLAGKQEIQVPDLLIDFKNYFTIPSGVFWTDYKEHYLATVNELFRENLSQRFCYYLSRIGLPELD